MSARDDILASIRINRPRVDRPLPAVPLFDGNRAPALLLAFKDNLERMGGLFSDLPESGDQLAPVRAKIASAKVVCSTVPEVTGNRDMASIGAPPDVADMDFAIVRASFGVAETGSILLSDSDLHINAVAYLAQHRIALLDPADIVINLHHAYRRRELRENHYASFHTGPSATVRSLSVLPIARAAGNPRP
jgi:L-lactate dehydrogenase complex protein LldG